MGKGRRTFWLFLALSVLLHVVWAVRMPGTDAAAKRAAPLPPVELSFSVVAQPPEQPRPEQVAPPEQPAPVAPQRTRRPLERRSAPAEPPAQQVTRAAPEASASEPVATAEKPSVAAAEPGASAIDLSPRMAASTLTPEQLAPPAEATCNPRVSAADGGCRPASDPLSVQARLNRELSVAANAKPYLVQREPPKLTRESDGSYAYAGRVFHARIASDGHVTFADKSPIGTGALPFGGSFDLTDATTKGELYPAERRWFLEHTEQLRDQLAEASRIEELARLRRSLERELNGVVDSASMDATRKRAAVFAIWQDCGEDGDAERTRKVVEAFVRRRMPQASELGFSVDELVRLNGTRSGMRAFAPYAGQPG
jgi:hypothetical protein